MVDPMVGDLVIADGRNGIFVVVAPAPLVRKW